MNPTFDRLWGVRNKSIVDEDRDPNLGLFSVCRWIVVAVVGLTVAAAVTLNGTHTGHAVAAVAGALAIALGLIPVLWSVWLRDRTESWNAWTMQSVAVGLLAVAAMAHAIGVLDRGNDTIRPLWIDVVRLTGVVAGAWSAIEIMRRQSPEQLFKRHFATASVFAFAAVAAALASTKLFSSSGFAPASDLVVGMGLIATSTFLVACLAATELNAGNQPQLLASSLALSWLAFSVDLVAGGVFRFLDRVSTDEATDWLVVIAGAFLFVSAIGSAGMTRSSALTGWNRLEQRDDDAELTLTDWGRIVAPYAIVACVSSAAWAVRDSSPIWVSIILVSTAAIVLGRQALIHAGGTRAIERSERALVDLAQRAMVDSVTELPNRRALDERLAEEVSHALRQKQPLSLCFVDIDHFKSVNDVHGHHTGDAILKHVGVILKRSLRDVDFIGRFGGEEFVVLVPETWSDEALHLGERLRKSIEDAEFTSLDKKKLRLTASVGIAGLPEHAHDAALLCIRADEALYGAKRSGRNRVMVFDPNDPLPTRA